MNEIFVLIIILGILFIIENKSINTLINYIGITLLLAIIIGLYNCAYISYILILVQISALTIIFGFIIMLYPKNNTLPNIPVYTHIPKTKEPYSPMGNGINPFGIGVYRWVYTGKKFWYFYLILVTLLIITLIINNIDLLQILKFDHKLIIPILNYNDKPLFQTEYLTNTQNNLLFKIGVNIFNDYNNIIKLLLLTLFLLFAIIALFFLILPTYF